MGKNKVIKKESSRPIFTAGIITASDIGARGEMEDESGKILDYMLKDRGFEIKYYIVIPGDVDRIQEALVLLCDDIKADLVITTGGIGFSKRDVMPEATLGVIDREAPGISEAIRYYGLHKSSDVMLTRGVSGIRRNTLIINLPGSVKGVRESFESIIDTIYHGLEVITEEN
ncbi:MAG: molybdenum cofactor synthesis domain protein [Clostridia bacterium]|jgi:molybdenum cofactor synthesis domain-containing protein|nr:molybdenum cofactor synthesis domain protein [Clostridia bacterium]